MSIQAYAHLPIFQDLNESQLRQLDKVMDHCHFPESQMIFDQGQMALKLFILVEGEVAVRYKPYDGPVLTVARILPGGIFGWSAALGRDRYTSGAFAVQSSSGFRISAGQLHQFCEANPETGSIFLEHMTDVIARRIKNTHTEILAILTQGMDLSADCWRRLDIHE